MIHKLISEDYEDFSFATKLVVYMLVMARKFDNVIHSKRGIGKVFSLVRQF